MKKIEKKTQTLRSFRLPTSLDEEFEKLVYECFPLNRFSYGLAIRCLMKYIIDNDELTDDFRKYCKVCANYKKLVNYTRKDELINYLKDKVEDEVEFLKEQGLDINDVK